MTEIENPRVNHERLRSLLAIEAETPELDFKRTLSLARKGKRDRKDRVELAKDVGAMSVDGGSIVIGVDDQGKPSGMFTAEAAALFDEASVRKILQKWIPDPLDIQTAQHEVSGQPVVLLHVAPNPQGLCIFQCDGEYTTTASDGSNRVVTVFRKGDVFVRHGTSSERWQQQDIDRILHRIREVEKNRWRDEAMEGWWPKIEASIEGFRRSAAPIASIDWRLPSEEFENIIAEQLRAGDDVALRMLLERMPPDAENLLEEGNWDEYETLLDRWAGLAGLTIRLDRSELLGEVITVVVNLYGNTMDRHGLDRRFESGLDINAVRLWAVFRIMAVGALAVRRGNWRAVRDLVLRRPRVLRQVAHGDPSLIRHAHVMAARTGMRVQFDGAHQEVVRAFIAISVEVAKRVPGLVVDLPARAPAEADDRLLTSLNQFDALAMLTVYGSVENTGRSIYYPSFSFYDWSRITPALESLIDDDAMRDILHPSDDKALAMDMMRMFAFAQKEGMRSGGWPFLENPCVEAFLKEHGEPVEDELI